MIGEPQFHALLPYDAQLQLRAAVREAALIRKHDDSQEAADRASAIVNRAVFRVRRQYPTYFQE